MSDGAPGEIRTPDPVLRRHVLYPSELRARGRRSVRLLAGKGLHERHQQNGFDVRFAFPAILGDLAIQERDEVVDRQRHVRLTEQPRLLERGELRIGVDVTGADAVDVILQLGLGRAFLGGLLVRAQRHGRLRGRCRNQGQARKAEREPADDQ